LRTNILLVEDEEALRVALSDRLRGEGYGVETAADGVDAFDKVRGLRFDLIILDVMLPDTSGFDLCRDIRQARIGTPIMLLSARDQIFDKVIGLRLGADDYVTKPFEAVELLARIEALLRQTPRSLPPAICS
jgi:two-component system, OmpR family, alkaline phosphatase synthesis response regulator PhoP